MNIFAWFAGADPERLIAHRSTSRYLVIAMGMVLVLVTGPIVALAMGSYVYQSLPTSLGITFRLLISICIGSVWMVMVWTIDRALIISSDTVGSGHRLLMGVGLALRFGLAGILASIFANQFVQLLYSDILNTTAPHSETHKFCPMLPPAVILDRSLNGEDKALYAWMLMQSRGNTICHASQKRMATELGWSVKKVQRCLAKLEGRFIKTNVDADGKSRDSYELLVRAPGRKASHLSSLFGWFRHRKASHLSSSNKGRRNG